MNESQNTWRLLGLEKREDSFMKMATEEAIMNAVRKKEVLPTLRFYSWSRPAVTVGYFQEAKKELNLDECKKDNIEIFRRLTGGGAVYKSPEYEINYSLIIREDEERIPKDVEESYSLICGAIIEGFKNLNLDLKFKPINDITLNGKKVSGNAQTRVNNVILHHGTILLKPEVEKMFKYLKIDDKKLLEKKVSSAKDLVTGVLEYRSVSKEEIISSIVNGFMKTFEVNFVESDLTTLEKEDANKIYSKYSDSDFVFWR
jgi:lipoate-protein ligase A